MAVLGVYTSLENERRETVPYVFVFFVLVLFFNLVYVEAGVVVCTRYVVRCPRGICVVNPLLSLEVSTPENISIH